MPDAVVIIPWAPGCSHRERALGYVLRRWAGAGLPVEIGRLAAGPWCKAAAVNAALHRARGEILVIADADVWCDGALDAIQSVRDGAPWAVPHRMLYRLSASATDDVLGGRDLAADLPTSEPPYVGFAGGGMVVLPRRTYERVPLDPRFVGWGQEDESWALALTTLAGSPWRGDAPMFHLWHPPQPRASRRFGSKASAALYRNYLRAWRDPGAMSDLLAAPRWEVTNGQGDAACAEGESAP